MNSSLKELNTSKAFTKILLPLAVLVPSFFWIYESDPFNAPKLLILGIGATALIFISFVNLNMEILIFHRALLLSSIFFILALLNPLLFSGAPFSTQIFGAYGRNTGFLNYLFLTFILVASSFLKTRDEIRKVFFSVFWVATINFVLCTLELFGINPQHIQHVYARDLVGSFGNPNFVSAFMAIFGSIAAIVFIGIEKRKFLNFIPLIFAISALFFAVRSHSNQGLIILFAGVILGILFKLHFLLKSNFYSLTINSLVLFVALIGIAGILNKGPLAKYLFENSVKFRWEYWKAGIQMFLHNPIHGVGLNSYGDWYRSARSPLALVSPGVDTTTNAAHNVFIDFASTGGAPLILAFLTIVLMGVRAFIKIMRNSSSFDYLPISIFVGWICYLAQAGISIDQIGLGIYGWIFPGLLVALSKLKSNDLIKENSVKNAQFKIKSKKEQELISARDLVGALAGSLIGFILVFPVVQSDTNWLNALKSSDAQVLRSAAMKWPRNENVVASFSKMLLQNKLYSESIEIAQSGVKEFPRSFITWQQIYANPQAPALIRQEALKKMIELDPLNPILKKSLIP